MSQGGKWNVFGHSACHFDPIPEEGLRSELKMAKNIFAVEEELNLADGKDMSAELTSLVPLPYFLSFHQ